MARRDTPRQHPEHPKNDPQRTPAGAVEGLFTPEELAEFESASADAYAENGMRPPRPSRTVRMYEMLKAETTGIPPEELVADAQVEPESNQASRLRRFGQMIGRATLNLLSSFDGSDMGFALGMPTFYPDPDLTQPPEEENPLGPQVA